MKRLAGGTRRNIIISRHFSRFCVSETAPPGRRAVNQGAGVAAIENAKRKFFARIVDLLRATGQAPRNDGFPRREFSSNMAPLELKLLENRRILAVTWDDGEITRLPAELLRRNSRAASAVRAAIDDDPPPPDEQILLTDIQLIGAYAVQLSFSDGHDRGIYPWVYLRELAAEAV